jgi:hypothetical protein
MHRFGQRMARASRRTRERRPRESGGDVGSKVQAYAGRAHCEEPVEPVEPDDVMT